MIPQKSNFFCIIVHFGSEQPTKQLVAQFLRGSIQPAGVIVVDNNEDFPPLSFHDPRIHLVQVGSNQGYAAGINKGLQFVRDLGSAPDDIVLCLNNDISIEEQTVERLLQHWNKQDAPTMAALSLGRLNGFTGRASIMSQDVSENFFTWKYLDGACLVAPLSVWDVAGVIPENYFLYWEDVLLSFQLRRQRVSLQPLPPVGIQHSDGALSSSSKKTYYLVRNGAHFLETELPVAWRMYWQALNALRRGYHLLLHHEVVVKALADRKTL